MTKPLVFLVFCVGLTTSSYGQLVGNLVVENGSTKINDVTARAAVSGGEEPYTYKWSNQGTALSSDLSKEITEGQDISVLITDANGAILALSGKVEPGSAEERINAIFLPLVNAMASVLFYDPLATFGIVDPTVYAEEAYAYAPGWKDQQVDSIRLDTWLVGDGEKVKKGQRLAVILQNERDTFSLFSPDSGMLNQIFEPGDKVFQRGSLKALSSVEKGVVATVQYDAPRPLTHPNGDPVKKNIPFIVIWLVLGAIFFTLKMRFINFRGFRHALSLVGGKYEDPSDRGEVSHFQALTTALSATVGLGNIAGVAIAIVIGGAGATFWMIAAGFLGMASKFTECTLGVKYRRIDENGVVSGGPMYYLSEGLKRRNMGTLGKVLAVVFAVLCVGGSFGGGNMFQVNQAFVQVSNKIPFFANNGALFGVIMAILVALVILGGIRSIAKVTDKIVPFMVGIYVGFSLLIIFMNITNIGIAFQAIWEGAFSPSALKGGVIGVLVVGFQRAAFSNEAGVGSASIAHSASRTRYPVSEGIVALLEPFVDTVVVCTMTALVLIFTGFAVDPAGLTGSELTSAAFTTVVPWFDWVLLVAIVLFAFSTMISWSYYGLKAWAYLFGESKHAANVYKLIFLIFIVVGASVGLGSVLDFSDLMILGMAFPNILGLVLLSGEVRNDLKAYLADLKSGVIRKFKA